MNSPSWMVQAHPVEGEESTGINSDVAATRRWKEIVGSATSFLTAVETSARRAATDGP